MPTVAEKMSEILETRLNEMETIFKNFKILDTQLFEFKKALVAKQEENVDLKKDIRILKKEKVTMKKEMKNEGYDE